jgi:hypothetical protein
MIYVIIEYMYMIFIMEKSESYWEKINSFTTMKQIFGHIMIQTISIMTKIDFNVIKSSDLR